MSSSIKGVPFVVTDLTNPVDNARSLHSLMLKYFTEIMKITPPFPSRKFPKVDNVASSLMVNAVSSHKFYAQLVSNLQSTDSKVLWPNFDKIPITPVSLLWMAAQQKKSNRKLKSSSSLSQDKPTQKEGQKKGLKNGRSKS